MSEHEGPQDIPPPGQPSGSPRPGGQYPPNWGSAYPPPPGQYPPGYGQPYTYAQPPKHPQATTAMVLGIVGLTGVMCCLTVFVAPFAWVIGARTVKAIDASGGALGGRSEANAGKIMGIIGTVLLILALAVGVLLLILTFTVDNFWDSSYDDNYDYGALIGVF